MNNRGKYNWSQRKQKLYLYYLIMCFFTLCIVVSICWFCIYYSIDSFKLLLDKIPMVNRVVDITDIKEVYKDYLEGALTKDNASFSCGRGLAVVGCTFQAIFRNSLADPHILGISIWSIIRSNISNFIRAFIKLFRNRCYQYFCFYGSNFSSIISI